MLMVPGNRIMESIEVTSMTPWFIIIPITVLYGGIYFSLVSSYKATLIAGLGPFIMFLLFNLYAESHSSSKEILDGSWLIFQMILGGGLSFLSVGSGLVWRVWKRTID